MQTDSVKACSVLDWSKDTHISVYVFQFLQGTAFVMWLGTGETCKLWSPVVMHCVRGEMISLPTPQSLHTPAINRIPFF